MRWLFTFIKTLLFALLFLFALQNTSLVSLNFFSLWQWQAPFALILLVFFAIGVLTGLLALLPSVWRWRRAARKKENATVPNAAPATNPPALPDGAQHGL